MHSWFSRALVEDGRLRGVIVETKAGRQAILGRVVIDTTGDGDVFASAWAPFVHGRYMLSLVHRLAGVDVERAIRFEREHPEEAKALNTEVKRIIGGSWDLWWLRTPREGVVWCNCPHMKGYDATSVEDLTAAQIEAKVARASEAAARWRRTPIGDRAAMVARGALLA